MICQMFCVGAIKSEPKRGYIGDNEVSNFFVSIKKKGKAYDVFSFEAWNATAKYINEYIHDGDLVSVISNPRRVSYKNKDGYTVNTVKFRAIAVDFICRKGKISVEKFDELDLPEIHGFNLE